MLVALFATYTIGQLASRIPCAGNSTLLFQPATSTTARLDGNATCAFQIDALGDYILNGGDQALVRVRGVAEDIDTPLRLSASFARAASPASPGLVSSDAQYDAWQSSPAGCAVGSSGALVLGPGCTAASTPAATEASPINPFEEPTQVQALLSPGPKGTAEVSLAIGGVSPLATPRAPGVIASFAIPERTVHLLVSNGTATYPVFGANLTAGSCGPLNVNLTMTGTTVSLSVECGGHPAADRNYTGHHYLKAAALGNRRGEAVVVLSAIADTVHVAGVIVKSLAGPEVPGVAAPVRAFARVRSPPLGEAHARAIDTGYLDVTLPPFSADPTGQRDATVALRRASHYARRNSLIVFLPPGEYQVTDTINCSQSNTLGSPRFFPFYFRGSTKGRATLVLPANTPGFGNSSAPRPVVYLWRLNAELESQPNSNMNQMWQNIHIRILDGNPGAVGIFNRGAQGSGIEDTTIWAGSALAGVLGASGSGGSQHNVTVVGGAYGLQFSEAQPAGTAAGVTLLNQRCAGLLYFGHQSFTLVGANITSEGGEERDPSYRPIIAGCEGDIPLGSPGSPCYLPPLWGGCQLSSDGHLSVVESSFDMRAPLVEKWPMIDTNASLYVARSYFRGAIKVGRFKRSWDTLRLPASASEASWSCLEEFAYNAATDKHPLSHEELGRMWNLTNPFYIVGQRNGDTLQLPFWATPVTQAPPADLQAQHLWPDTAAFPSFESEGAANVRDAPYHAVGDGIADDTAAIQRALQDHDVVLLPRGFYRVSQTLEVRPGAALVGPAHHLVMVGPVSRLASRDPWPLIRVGAAGGRAAGANAGPNTLFGVSCVSWYHSANVTCLDWQAADPQSVFRQNAAWLHSEQDASALAGLPPPPPSPHPGAMNRVQGRGKFFTVHAEDQAPMTPDYRHWLVDGTDGPVRFYHLNTEHAKSDANAEIRDASNVDIYGLKSEGRFCVLWIRRATNVTLSGYGGNACPYPSNGSYPAGGYAPYPPSIFRIEASRSITLANLVAYDMDSTLPAGVASGIPCGPLDVWNQVIEARPTVKGASGGPKNASFLRTLPLDRPILYKTEARAAPQPP